MAKNITLAIDDEILEKVRIVAAKRKTTVNGLVRDHLRWIARGEDETRRALAELRAMSNSTKARLGPGWRFDRDGTHDR
jgi:hypothetical protein